MSFGLDDDKGFSQILFSVGLQHPFKFLVNRMDD